MSSNLAISPQIYPECAAKMNAHIIKTIGKYINNINNFEYSYDNVRDVVDEYIKDNANMNWISIIKLDKIPLLDNEVIKYIQYLAVTRNICPLKNLSSDEIKIITDHIMSEKNIYNVKEQNNNSDQLVLYIHNGEVQEIGNSGLVNDFLSSL